MKPSYATTLVFDYQHLVKRFGVLLGSQAHALPATTIALKKCLRSVLPSNWALGSGYVQLDPSRVSPLINVIIYRADQPLLFREEDWIVVEASAVISLFQVSHPTELSAKVDELGCLKKEAMLVNCFMGLWAPEKDSLEDLVTPLPVGTRTTFNRPSTFDNPLESLLAEWISSNQTADPAVSSSPLAVSEDQEAVQQPDQDNPTLTSKEAPATLLPLSHSIEASLSDPIEQELDEPQEQEISEDPLAEPIKQEELTPTPEELASPTTAPAEKGETITPISLPGTILAQEGTSDLIPTEEVSHTEALISTAHANENQQTGSEQPRDTEEEQTETQEGLLSIKRAPAETDENLPEEVDTPLVAAFKGESSIAPDPVKDNEQIVAEGSEQPAAEGSTTEEKPVIAMATSEFSDSEVETHQEAEMTSPTEVASPLPVPIDTEGKEGKIEQPVEAKKVEPIQEENEEQGEEEQFKEKGQPEELQEAEVGEEPTSSEASEEESEALTEGEAEKETSKEIAPVMPEKVLNPVGGADLGGSLGGFVIPSKQPLHRRRATQTKPSTEARAQQSSVTDAPATPEGVRDGEASTFQIPIKTPVSKPTQTPTEPKIKIDPKTGNHPLHEAVNKRDFQMVSQLVQAGAELEMKNKEGNTALHLAVYLGLKEIVSNLLAAGADVNARNYVYAAPLHMAVEENHLDALVALLGHEAEVEARNNRGKTPLHIAAIHGRVAAAQKLIEGYADIHANMEKDMQPLHLAAWYGQGEIIQLLIEQGADVNAANIDGNTALHFAAFKGQVRAIKTLINHQADMSLKNNSGLTYLQGINEGYSGEMIRVLE